MRVRACWPRPMSFRSPLNRHATPWSTKIMATTLAQITGFFDEGGLRYETTEKGEIVISLGFDPDVTDYRDTDGDPNLLLVVKLVNNGEMVRVFAPNAWNIKRCRFKTAVFESLILLQSRFTAVRFDYAPDDGEIRPNVEHILEDAELTSNQFQQLGIVLVTVINLGHAFVSHAMKTGEVDTALLPDHSAPTAPQDMTEDDRLQQLAAEAGGIEALEDLLGGSDSQAD
jgi:hypothetical protein